MKNLEVGILEAKPKRGVMTSVHTVLIELCHMITLVALKKRQLGIVYLRSNKKKISKISKHIKTYLFKEQIPL